MHVISWHYFDFETFAKIKPQKNKKGNPGGVKKKYLDIITAFDIETTNINIDAPDNLQSIMYVWQWAFGPDLVVIGRTWSEFREFCAALTARIPDGVALVVFVHNLSFEWQWIKSQYDFQPEDVFALAPRKVCKCAMNNSTIEFRCSYIHSNMALSDYTHKMGAIHGKLSGAKFDYSKKRYPWTELSVDEMMYCINDVVGLVEAIQIEMSYDQDNLKTFPLTSTGYVRRDIKRAMKNESYNWLHDQLPDMETYLVLKEAFRGGNTHANRYYVGQILHNVKSADRSSSYPDTQCNDLYPVGKFFKIGECGEEKIRSLIYDRKKAVLMRITITNVRLRDPYFGCPYISKSKCRDVSGQIEDNGRILSAARLSTTLTDIDFKILESEYQWDTFECEWAAYARYGKLPESLRECIISYYRAKTELKNVAGQELFYMKSKNKLNSIYGCSAMDIVKILLEFRADPDNPDLPKGFYPSEEKTPDEILQESNRKAFQNYAWGVWCTANARYRLEEGIRLAGEHFVYCDTDSVKYLGDIDWTAYNAERIKASTESGAFATDPEGITHYMGVYEQEHPYDRFATLGAKKYAYEIGGKLGCTIAGVSKKYGAAEMGTLENFIDLHQDPAFPHRKVGFTFYKAGGLESIYNDDPTVKHVIIDGYDLDICSNVALQPSSYTLGITDRYDRLLSFIHSGAVEGINAEEAFPDFYR